MGGKEVEFVQRGPLFIGPSGAENEMALTIRSCPVASLDLGK
jgi:hypothetical protein